MNNIVRLMLCVLFSVAVAVGVCAQETPAEPVIDAAANAKKTIKEATISLQTTVTGNQEQPRVLYILPWQSPLGPELEIEMLDSQQEEVFGHVEREELTRELEASGELQ